MIDISMMQVIQIKQDVVNKFEEENRQGVIDLITQVVEKQLGGAEVDTAKVEEEVNKWFSVHKNHVEEFAEELMEYSEKIAKQVKRNKKEWKK